MVRNTVPTYANRGLPASKPRILQRESWYVFATDTRAIHLLPRAAVKTGEMGRRGRCPRAGNAAERDGGWAASGGWSGPAEFDALAFQVLLEIGQLGGGFADAVRGAMVTQRVSGQASGGFADAPFHGMQAVAAGRQVRRADILAGGDQVGHPTRQQRAERDFEGQRFEIDVVVAARRRMQIDVIAADADRVVELGPPATRLRSGR
jgi:hypothetical protein